MAELLAIDRLQAGYGQARVLNGLSLSLGEGQALALLGRNGMGKTTLINTIVGVTRYFGGAIRLDGRDISGLRPDQRAHAGIGWVPQERNIFRSLTVEENLTAVARPGRWTLTKVYDMFPRLKERRGNLGNQLSGGEQQMLAVGRALMAEPRLLLVDELSLGLMPKMVDLCLDALMKLKDEGLSILLVEQNTARALDVADRVSVLASGVQVFSGTTEEARAAGSLFTAFLSSGNEPKV
jgi:branched-chain amino acid transport system ATP-binding protein